MARIIYAAIGDFPPERRAGAEDLLRTFDQALASGATPDQAAATLPEFAHSPGAAAARLIRRFEARVGEECGAQVGHNSSPLAGIPSERSLSLENRDARMFDGDGDLAELAAAVAAALGALLGALGATRTIWGHID